MIGKYFLECNAVMHKIFSLISSICKVLQNKSGHKYLCIWTEESTETFSLVGGFKN